jgi:short-subunit dehydrogenase
MRLDGTRALVTGASSGIGAATATALAHRGARVLLTGRDRAALTALANRVDGLCRPAELTDAEQLAELADWASGVDVVVANAGVGWAGRVVDMPLAKVDELIAVNLTAPVRLARLLLPHLLARGRGHLVFVTSIAGSMGVAEEAVYSAAKAGLRAFADSVRLEVAGTGVGVSVVAPGVVSTEFFARRGRPYDRATPRPIPASQVARALVRAVEQDVAEVFAPGWLRFPARLNGAFPVLTSAMQRRFG